MKLLNETKTNHILPYHLQFFAEPIPEPTPTPAPTPDPEPTPPEPQLSVEEQLTKIMVENKRLKAATDKATAEAAENKRKLREKMSETEKYDAEKAEREAKFQADFDSLKRENAINKMAKSLIASGYAEEQAIKASEAYLDQDFGEFTRIQQAFIANRDKQRESEWMKNLPTPPAGNGSGDDADAFIKGFDKG
jgi:hypothetical protein